MPTIVRVEGFRIVIYPNDHPPEHAHVMSNDWEAIFKLNCPAGKPELRENYRFNSHQLSRIYAALLIWLDELCEAWSKIHGV